MYGFVYIYHREEYMGFFFSGVVVVEMEVIFTVELGQLNETSSNHLLSPQIQCITLTPH